MDKNAALGQPFVPQLQTVVNEDSPWDAIPMLLPCHAGDHRHIGPQLSCTPPTLLWCCPFSNRQSSQDGGLVWPQRLKELLTLRHPGKLVVESIGSPLVDRSQRPPQLGRRDRVGRPTEDATDEARVLDLKITWEYASKSERTPSRSQNTFRSSGSADCAPMAHREGPPVPRISRQSPSTAAPTAAKPHTEETGTRGNGGLHRRADRLTAVGLHVRSVGWARSTLFGNNDGHAARLVTVGCAPKFLTVGAAAAETVSAAQSQGMR